MNPRALRLNKKKKKQRRSGRIKSEDVLIFLGSESERASVHGEESQSHIRNRQKAGERRGATVREKDANSKTSGERERKEGTTRGEAR